MSTDAVEGGKKLVEHASANAAADAADTLANYLQWKRPDLEESIASIHGLGEAIRRSMPVLGKDAQETVDG